MTEPSLGDVIIAQTIRKVPDGAPSTFARGMVVRDNGDGTLVLRTIREDVVVRKPRHVVRIADDELKEHEREWVTLMRRVVQDALAERSLSP